MKAKVFEISLALLFGVCATSYASCPTDGASVAQTVEFLKQAKSDSSASPECVIAAIERLDGTESPEVIDVLVSYIEFQRTPEKYVQTHLPTTARLYPATEALFSIGAPVLPALIRVIQEGTSSDVARKNAVYTVMSIYRKQPQEGVKFLLNAAAKSMDAAEADRLKRAASDAVPLCATKVRPQCEAALQAGSK